MTIRVEDGGTKLRLVVCHDGRALEGGPPSTGTPLFRDDGQTRPPGSSVPADLINRLGARITSENRLGLWTRVALHLPRAAAEERRSGDGDSSGSTDRRQMQVLVVEDNAALRSVIRRCLETRGHTVVEAADGGRGLEVAEQEDFDRLLVDIQMPVRSGLDLYEGLARVRPAMQSKVIFMTGGFTELFTQEAVEEPGRPVIHKPFDLNLLVDAVEAA